MYINPCLPEFRNCTFVHLVLTVWKVHIVKAVVFSSSHLQIRSVGHEKG